MKPAAYFGMISENIYCAENNKISMAQIDGDGIDINADQSANAPRFLLNYYQSAGSMSESDQENFSVEEDRRECDGGKAPKKVSKKKVVDGGKGKNGKGKGSEPSGKKTGKGSGVVKKGRVQKKNRQKEPARKSIKGASAKARRRPTPSDKQSASLSHEIDLSSLNGKVEDDWQHLSLRQTARLYIENVYISNWYPRDTRECT